MKLICVARGDDPCWVFTTQTHFPPLFARVSPVEGALSGKALLFISSLVLLTLLVHYKNNIVGVSVISFFFFLNLVGNKHGCM